MKKNKVTVSVVEKNPFRKFFLEWQVRRAVERALRAVDGDTEKLAEAIRGLNDRLGGKVKIIEGGK